MDILTKILIFFSDIYTNIYGDIYRGSFDIHDTIFLEPVFLEKFLFLFPSFINHLYGRNFYNCYLYEKNNLLYISNIKESKKLNPPLFNFTLNNIEMKNKILKFSNNIPLRYILLYYNFALSNQSIKVKYLKNGFKTSNLNLNDIKNLSLVDILT